MSFPAVRSNPLGHWLRNRRLRTKMLGLALVAAAVAVTVGAVAQYSLSTADASGRAVVAAGAEPATLASQAATYWARYRQYVLTVVVARDSTQVAEASQALTGVESQLDATLASYLSTVHDPAALARMKTVQADVLHASEIYHREIQKAAQEANSQLEANAVAAVVGTAFNPIADRAAADLDALLATDRARTAGLLKDQLAVAERSSRVLWIAVALGSVLIVLIGLLIARAVVAPVAEVRDALQALADGDLTVRLDIVTTEETGQMAAALGHAQASLRAVLADIGSSAAVLAASAEELDQVSAQVAGHAMEASARSDTAADAAQRVSGNVHQVATATRDVNASAREISDSSAEAVRVVQVATEQAAQANATVAKLSASSQEIGDVIRVITTIAEQTDLLALNATIEAARAGDAGRGFAVVASEVKELAAETSRATGHVEARIEAIQADTAAAITAIGRITTVIEEVRAYQATIAAAVSEQAVSTDAMARNVTEAAHGSTSISQDIGSVAASARASSEGVAKAQRSANELARLSTELRDVVGRFRL